MNILITGATGFIGENLAKRLIAEQHTVHALIRPQSDISHLPSRIHIFKFNGDIKDLATYMKEQQINIVYHLASLIIPEHSTDQIPALIESNILLGTQLLEAMSLACVKNMINTGTSLQHFQAENNEYHPVCLYAATKEAFEKIIEFYIEQNHIHVITLQLFNTYGEGDRSPRLINLLSRFAIEKTELDMTPGEQEIDLTHIKDIVQAFITATTLLLHEQPAVHQKYGISSGKVITLKSLINRFQEITGQSVKINWGGRAYRQREVMKTWKHYTPLPGWQPSITLEEGLKCFFCK